MSRIVQLENKDGPKADRLKSRLDCRKRHSGAADEEINVMIIKTDMRHIDHSRKAVDMKRGK